MPYAGHPRSHTQSHPQGAIRGGHTACWFSMGLGTTGEVIHRGHTQKTELFFRYIAIRGPYGKPYVEVIRRGHTWSCFSMVSGPAVEAIRGGHTRRPYAENQYFFFDKLPYAGHTEIHTRRSYAELFYNGNWPCAGSHARRPYEIFVFDIYF